MNAEKDVVAKEPDVSRDLKRTQYWTHIYLSGGKEKSHNMTDNVEVDVLLGLSAAHYRCSVETS